MYCRDNGHVAKTMAEVVIFSAIGSSADKPPSLPYGGNIAKDCQDCYHGVLRFTNAFMADSDAINMNIGVFPSSRFVTTCSNEGNSITYNALCLHHYLTAIFIFHKIKKKTNFYACIYI
jgi:hypothetical protein